MSGFDGVAQGFVEGFMRLCKDFWNILCVEQEVVLNPSLLY